MLKDVEYKEKNYKQPLLTKVATNNYNDDELDYLFSHFFTYGHPHRVYRDNEQDKYCYNYSDNIIYGINEFEDEKCSFFRGICYESTNCNLIDFLPYNIRIQDYKELNEKEVLSAMIFKGTIKNSSHNFFEVYKYSDKICIKYLSKSFVNISDDVPYNIMIDEEFNLPIMSEGKITSMEIENIILALQTKFENNYFISVISENMKIFAGKINNREGKVIEEYDSLSPNILINMSFDDVVSMVDLDSNKNFELMLKEFESLTNISRDKICVKK